MYCVKCGAELLDGAKICYKCGTTQSTSTKYCQHCGRLIDEDCVVCPKCGKQVGQLKAEQPQIVINNSNNNQNQNINTNVGFYGGRPKNKVVALVLCIFFGYLGVHKFYEEKPGMGVLYLFTLGLFGIGWIVDFIVLLGKPDIYYV